ncbi:MAG TPA: alpha-mannosidase, partial [Polyangiaceae bacterium]|nr:alpha-mannosidase [Polyangiaceae bacterium]
IGWQEAQGLEYRPARLGQELGPEWATFWFRGKANVPEAWNGRRVDLLWVTHSEATLWLDGRAAQGLNYEPAKSGYSFYGSRPDARLTARALAGSTLEFQIEVACNGPFGLRDRRFRTQSPYLLDRAELALFDEQAWSLYFDFLVLVELEAEADNGLEPSWAGALHRELSHFANAVDPDDRSTWKEARSFLERLYAHKNASQAYELSAIGHAHIDTAWLWPLAESYRKCVRSFSSQLAYMDRYPEYRFACSQAQQYEWIRERDPELFARIAEKVKGGQWVPVGGSWVEPDCNLPSGESLARQLLYGQRFFQKHFGGICKEFWQPDVFGYNGQLPQLMRQAGMTRFLTQKLSWNRFNKPEHQTLRWQGVDGSEVLAHFPPADTYNSVANVHELRASASRFKDHPSSGHGFLLFGYGDGGGGPTPHMLEVLRRAVDLQGVPRTVQRTSDEFFSLLEAEGHELPVLVGELYFEFHRGTYTTQAKTKLGNRRSEDLLHDVEFLSAVGSRLGLFAYPGEALERIWKSVLTNQFHDILPGSSIGLVYEDAERDYDSVTSELGEVRERAASALLEPADDSVPINTLPFPRAELCEHPRTGLVWVECEPYGIGRVAETDDRVSLTELERGGWSLENKTLRAEILPDGSVVSLVHLPSGREALSASANVFELYDDHPNECDAWDIDPFHLETLKICPPAEVARVAVHGGLRAAIEFRRRIGEKSSLRQVIALDAGARRLEFHTHVDWQESHRLLKVAFPVDVRAMTATYEMQFGVVERPTHFNTSHDFAKYEVPGHRFADLAEHGFGLALLSNCKYGYSTLHGVMRLSLLRASTSPDPKADRGEHQFSYALYPHSGSWQEAGVVAEARRFGVPVVWARGKAQPGSFFSSDDPNLVLDTVKRSEDGHALVLRLYEAHGARGQARIRTSLPVSRATLCDILETAVSPVPVSQGMLEVGYRPFQILTIKLE